MTERHPHWASLMAPDWAAAMGPVARDIVGALALYDEIDTCVLPAKRVVFSAFSTPLSEVRVLIVGQDPYPTPGHAMGLAFSVPRGTQPLPPTLRNILRELHQDIGQPMPPHGDLTSWQHEGVMLLNRTLTVAAGHAGSHRGGGWERVTDHAARVLAERGGPLVAVLWGRSAQELLPQLPGVATVMGPHPSPLSARRGFLGSRPFSQVNSLLLAQGGGVVDWSLGKNCAY
jgi:uracil-DNA glycosylase